MDNQTKTSWWQAHRPTTRRLAQLYSALLYNAHLKGFIEGEIYQGKTIEGEIYQGKTKYLCVPGFNCYSCPGAVGACPLGSIQNALDSAGHRAGWYVLGMILLFGVVLGRTICGWLCPLGLIQELLHKIPSPKIRKSCVTRALSWLKYVILAVFAVAIPLWYGLKFGIPVPGFCKYICPAGTFEGAIGLLSNPVNAPKLGMLGILFTRKFIIMLIIGASCVFLYRSFCRFLCPLGAIYGLFNRFNVIGVKVDQSRCTHCGACVRNCGMDVRKVGDHECINCGKCMEFCSQDAISIKAGSITLKAPKGGCAQDGPDAPEKRRRTGRIIWSAAILLLCAALIWYNLLDRTEETKTGQASESALSGAAANADDGKEAAAEKTDETGAAGAAVAESEDSTSVKEAETEAKKAAASAAETEAEKAAASAAETEAEKTVASAAETETEKADGAVRETEASAQQDYTSDTPVGFEVGQQLEDFTVECLDGSTFHLADTRGKVTFINLWAVYCAPCVAELPYFNELYKEHEGDVSILCIHNTFITKDPKEFLSDFDYAMNFATDPDGSLFKIVNGGSTLPQTIVLNRRGEVIYNQVKSVTPEMLEALYQEAVQ